MRLFKLAFASLVAALAMGFSAQSASAYDLTISPAGGISAAGTVSFSDAANVIRLICPQTLSGSLVAGPVSLSAGSQIGSIDTVTIGSCTGGSGLALVEAPWPIRISTHLGALPNGMTGFAAEIEGFAWELTVRILGIAVRCLYAGRLGALMGVTGSNPYTSGSLSLVGNTVPKYAGSGACPASARFDGTLSFRPAQTFTVT